MTWIFLYSFLFLLGLLLAGSTGLLRRLPFLAHHHNVVMPVPEHDVTAFTAVARRLSCGLALFGISGVLLTAASAVPSRTVLGVSAGVGAVAALLAGLFLRPSCAELRDTANAVAVRDIAPGGYGQVRFDQAASHVMMAAQNVDAETILAGAAVEVIDCERSVLTVRRA